MYNRDCKIHEICIDKTAKAVSHHGHTFLLNYMCHQLYKVVLNERNVLCQHQITTH